jgi:hypothetical protein
MDDEQAFMTLVLANSQSELTALERGMHALRSGLSVRDYAERAQRSKSAVDRERAAAEVWKTYDPGHGFSSDKIPHAKNLAEIHATASWLWPALVARLVAEGWNVETARGHADRLKDVPEPPA